MELLAAAASRSPSDSIVAHVQAFFGRDASEDYSYKYIGTRRVEEGARGST